MTRTKALILGLLSLSTPALALKTACYNSLGNLTPSHTTTEYQSVALCQQFCHAENKPVYAVQDRKCFCGDTLPPLEAKVENTECMTRCPGYPVEHCGGEATYTIGSTTKSRTQRAIYTAPETDAETRTETEANGILTAPDVDDGDTDPLASLSVNPTMVRTASNAPTGTDSPKSILTASAYPNQPSSAVPTSAATAAPTASASASSSVSTSGVASPSASVATGAAAGRGIGREMLLGGVLAGLMLGGLF
ncbi:WSC domain protein [Aspergillus bombycis]|uniref:WSC domain protein n=1 Tax=Aspergillus bombycis TaxID=109264 RepID=A0A1F8A853_9EURO|nr:WSC domain protein [Aspergillus bombycis]OGM47853.1 WSC domain protein [Aspergillus bombycis]